MLNHTLNQHNVSYIKTLVTQDICVLGTVKPLNSTPLNKGQTLNTAK